MREGKNKVCGIAALTVVYVIAISLFYMNGLVSLSTLNSKYLFLSPLGIVIAVVAMSSGISGSNFWVPVNVIVLNH